MRLPEKLTPLFGARLFAASNIAFLGVDIALAHLANDFAHAAEWSPVVFSAVATLCMLPGVLGLGGRVVAMLDAAVGWGAVIVGVVGMVLHLQSGFFAVQTLHNLVYSAPFVAPLSYVGVGLLVLLLRSPEVSTPAFGPWLLLLALGGFIGNYGLSVLDHAQNGFFHVTEWIPVGSAALAIGILVVTLASPRAAVLRACLAVMAVQVAVGLGGFALHLGADLQRPAPDVLDRFVFGAPAFAPLLFADIALLAVIGAWASGRSTPTAVGGGEAPETP